MAISTSSRRVAARGARRERRAAPVRGFLPLVALLVVWQLIGDPTSVTLPPPSTWIEALDHLHSEGELLPALGATTKTFLISLGLATIVGTVIGTPIGASRRVDKALAPTLEFLRALPPPGYLPLALLLLGVNSRTAIVIVTFASMWPVLFSSAAAMRALPPIRLEVAKTFSLSRGERLRKIVLPSLAPGIVLGVRVAAPIALIATVLVEILTSVEGLGTLLLAGQRSFNSPEVFAALVVIGALGYLVSVLVTLGERRALRNWPPGSRTSAISS